MLVKLEIFPNFRGENKQYLSCHHPGYNYPLLESIGSMYGVFAYIWLIFMVNVGKYTIHGSYGY